MSPPGRSENRENASTARSPIAMLRGSENWVRKPPAARLVDPEESDSRSSRHTSTPASARWNAMLVPTAPPPTTTTFALAGGTVTGSPPDEAPGEEEEVRRPLRESPHEVWVPVRAERRRHEHLVPLGGDGTLERRPHAVEHLELEAVARDPLARREGLGVPDEPLVVGRDCEVR